MQRFVLPISAEDYELNYSGDHPYHTLNLACIGQRARVGSMFSDNDFWCISSACAEKWTRPRTLQFSRMNSTLPKWRGGSNSALGTSALTCLAALWNSTMLAMPSPPYIVAEKPAGLKIWESLVIRESSPYTPEDLHSYREAQSSRSFSPIQVT